jgi:hypothetical protein
MNPRLWRKGNPNLCSIVENCLKSSNAEGSAYVPNGDSPLTPWELQNIRMKLISSNDISDLQLWVMILISCKLFLCSEEICQIKFEDFNGDISCVNSEGTVSGLALKIQGKSDVVPVTLMLWEVDDIPELCPIRSLLLYIHILGNESGFLFPPKKDITTNKKHYDVHIPLCTYQDRFFALCKGVVARGGPFGSHSCRKTGYLLAVWGKGDNVEIKRSARHKTDHCVEKYRKDSQFLLLLAEKNNPSLKGVISMWKPSFIEDIQLGRSINSRCYNNWEALKTLSDNFVFGKLKIDSEHPQRNISFLFQKANEYKSTSSIEEQIETYLSKLDNTSATELKYLIQRYAQETTRSSLENIENNFLESPKEEILAIEETIANQGDSVLKKRKRGGENDLSLRNSLKLLKSTREKMEMLLQIEQLVPDDLESLTSGARAFVFTVLRPIVGCLKHHHNGCLESFEQSWNNISPSTFKKKVLYRKRDLQ